MNMYTWGIASAGFLATVLLFMILFREKWRDGWHLSGLQLFTAGLYGAILILLLPIKFDEAVWQDMPLMLWLRALLLSVPEAVRAFVLEGDFATVEEMLPADGSLASLALRSYGTCLYFLAPLMTFSNVLASFSNVWAHLHLRFCGKRAVVVFSALNEASVALAESVYRESRNQMFGRPLIVFAGITDGENDLQQRAGAIGGVLLKKSPARLSIGKRSRSIEFFLIAEQEEENVEQALLLTKRYKDGCHKVSVFVCASSARADMVLDYPLEDKKISDEKLLKNFRNLSGEILYDDALNHVDSEIFGNFSLRRVDPAHALAMDVLTRHDYGDYEALYAAAKEDKTISVLMLGMDSAGVEFLKTAAWFYQRYGYRVEFNVFCGQNDEWNEVRLRRSCPELFLKFGPTSGESCHDIRFFEDIDLASAAFEELFCADTSADKERLGRTKLAFLSLGDDEKNIDAAVLLRGLFDRLHGETRDNKDVQPIPYIYCVVRSDKRAEILSANKGLYNYKWENLHIDFVGAFEDQYSYARFQRIRGKEAEAFPFHLDWVRKEAQLHAHYDRALREHADEHFLREIAGEMACGSFSWNDGGYYEDEARTVINAGKLLKEAAKYICHAYYRQSSIAKLEHKTAVSRFQPDTRSHGPVCNCDACREKRITEHMRWNAYMRSIGYRRGEVRFDRAMVHNDLKPWDQLPCRERYKD